MHFKHKDNQLQITNWLKDEGAGRQIQFLPNFGFWWSWEERRFCIELTFWVISFAFFFGKQRSEFF